MAAMRGDGSVRLFVKETRVDLAGQAERQFRKRVRRAMRSATGVLLENVQLQLRKRTGPKPAPAQEPPARQSGELAKSFRRLPIKVKRFSASGGIYTDDPGAARLEWGKVDGRGIRTFPHPYIGPAAAAALPAIEDRFRAVVSDDAVE